MDSFSAIANGERNRGKPLMVFDWDKAAQIIKDSKCDSAEAGLSGDWEWTGGVIFEDGKPCDKENTYTYLAQLGQPQSLKWTVIPFRAGSIKIKPRIGALKLSGLKLPLQLSMPNPHPASHN